MIDYFIDFLVESPKWFIAIWVALGTLSSFLVWQAVTEARDEDA